MNSIRVPAYLFILVFVAITGCGMSDSVNADHYAVKGKVININRTQSSITIEHDDIPGLLTRAKTLFDVEDRKMLEGLHSGDWVHGQLKVEGGKNIITELKKW
jgi:Cu/Ag efflux protein CusF